MAALAERVQQTEPRIRKRSETDFNPDYLPAITRGEIKEDIISFLYEYRLQTQKFGYEYLLTDGKIRDVHRGEDMSTKMQFALWERSIHGLPTRREEAELRGLSSLEEQLQTATSKDLVVWASPPGPKEENYRDYGFVFIGQIDEQDQEKRLKMTAVRVDKPTLDQFNQAFTALIGQETQFKTAEQFLESPRVVKETDRVFADKVLTDSFGFKEDPSKKVSDTAIIEEMDGLGLLDDFVRIMQEGTYQEKKEALNVIQNWVIERQKNWQSNEKIVFSQVKIEMLAGQYGFEPPEVKGSCPGSTNSNNTLNKSSSLNLLAPSDEFGPLEFECPSCGKKNVRSYGKLLANCQHCNSSEVGCE